MLLRVCILTSAPATRAQSRATRNDCLAIIADVASSTGRRRFGMRLSIWTGSSFASKVQTDDAVAGVGWFHCRPPYRERYSRRSLAETGPSFLVVIAPPVERPEVARGKSGQVAARLGVGDQPTPIPRDRA